jgi:gluconate 2-dehydrogenase alpha chain
MYDADVVIVGLGAAGGVAADVLTQAGVEVLALEAGPRLDASATRFDEIANIAHARLSEPKAKHEVPTWRFDEREEAGPSPYPMLMVNAVGGTTVHYEGLSIRLAPHTFQGRSAAVERYGEDAIPAGATLADWPLSYADLEPHYAAIEHAIGVAGTAYDGATVGAAAGNAFEGPRSGPFPMGPLRTTGWADLTAGAAERLGWHPFAAPASLNSEPYDDRPACTYCGFCMYNVCHNDAKGAAHLNVIRRAEETGRLRIETGARALDIAVDADGRARGVRFVDAGGEERFAAARAVLVGTYTFENVRLLLLSRSAAHPDGLANDHGQVGRHFMVHACPIVYGLFPGRRLNLFTGVGAQATCLDDFDGDNFDHDGLGFLSGGMIASAAEATPVAFGTYVCPPGLPRWGAEWKAWMARNAQSVGGVFAQFDALPYEHNRLDLDPRVTDPLGVPVVRVTHRLGENEERAMAFYRERLHEWLREAGATETWDTPLHIEARHAFGGTRMGPDPATSVVDGFGFAHDAPNLGILGASTFPSMGGHNPTLTVQALARRSALRLIEDWSAIAG